MRTLLRVVLLGLIVGCDGGGGRPASEGSLVGSTPRPRGVPGPRLTMEALHKMGGVPAGWLLSPPPGDVDAGRALYVDLGCHSCHKVAGEPFEAEAGSEGPELTGMGAHHPPGYFVEAILNPDAVLVEGPGWIGPDGHSTMPSYPDLTLAQLADLVAYLSSLKTGGDHAGHAGGEGMPPGHCPPSGNAGTGGPTAGAVDPSTLIPANLVQRPDPPPTAAQAFFVQSYEVLPGKVEAFTEWFQREGAKRFLAFDGLVSVETFVDLTRPGPAVTSVFAFRDRDALNAFVATHDPSVIAVGTEFDAFVGDHDHRVFVRPPLYKVPALSTP